MCVKEKIHTDVGTTKFALITTQNRSTTSVSGREQRDTAQLIYTYQIISQCPKFLEVSFSLLSSTNPPLEPVPVDSSIQFQPLPQFQGPPWTMIFFLAYFNSHNPSNPLSL